MQLTTQYRSPTPQTMASVAPLTTPDTNTPQPAIVRPMPSITMREVHSGVGTEAFGSCGLSRWIAAHPIVATAGLVGIFLLVSGGQQQSRKRNPIGRPRTKQKNPSGKPKYNKYVVLEHTYRPGSSEAATLRAKRLAAKTGKPVQVRSRTFDGFGRQQKVTFWERTVMPDGSVRKR